MKGNQECGLYLQDGLYWKVFFFNTGLTVCQNKKKTFSQVSKYSFFVAFYAQKICAPNLSNMCTKTIIIISFFMTDPVASSNTCDSPGL